jgi:hypothetical protein
VTLRAVSESRGFLSDHVFDHGAGWGGGLGAEFGYGECGSGACEADGSGQGGAFGDGHGESAIEDVSGGGSVDGIDFKGGDEGACILS